MANTKVAHIKVNGGTCSAHQLKYPECHCYECIENIIEMNGIKKHSVVQSEDKSIFVVMLCPLSNCMDIFYDNNHALAPYELSRQKGSSYGWANIKSAAGVQSTDIK